MFLPESRAAEAVMKNENAESLHELGRVYLAEKNFDNAIKQFEKAVEFAPNNAKLHNDLGVALMEKANLSDQGKLENLAKANEEFAKAIELDKNSTRRLFQSGINYSSSKFTESGKRSVAKISRTRSDLTVGGRSTKKS